MFTEAFHYSSLPKLSNVISHDELRPTMCHAWVTQSHIVASDAHILVRLRTSEFFPQEIIKIIPPDGWFFDIHLLRMLQKEKIKRMQVLQVVDNYSIFVSNPQFKPKTRPYMHIEFWNEHTVMYLIRQLPEVGRKYPNVEDLIEKIKTACENHENTVDKLALNPKHLVRLHEGLDPGSDVGLRMHFKEPTHGIYVLPNNAGHIANGREGLIMPMMITV